MWASSATVMPRCRVTSAARLRSRAESLRWDKRYARMENRSTGARERGASRRSLGDGWDRARARAAGAALEGALLQGRRHSQLTRLLQDPCRPPAVAVRRDRGQRLRLAFPVAVRRDGGHELLGHLPRLRVRTDDHALADDDARVLRTGAGTGTGALLPAVRRLRRVVRRAQQVHARA